MSHAVLDPTGVAQRYETHRSQLMTLWVTRQDQKFTTSGDLQLCDVELINAHVELVGEPGQGYNGYESGITNTVGFKSSLNAFTLQDNPENKILQKSHLNHGHANISIHGMTQPHQFRVDYQQPGNDIQFLIPTDLGLLSQRNHMWPAHPLMLERVHLQQSIQVHTEFAGTWPHEKRKADFVEDWADNTIGITTRNEDGTVRYTISNDEVVGSTAECQVPANTIEHVKLVFKITPRTML